MIMKKCKEGRSILMALPMDANGNEVLEWAISRAAEQGDRVLTVHVCRDSDLKNTTTLFLIKVLEDNLAAHESSCNLKQIILVGPVLRRNAIRKVLVKEAKLCDAMKVVVVVNKHISLGGSASLAKYCAKKLPPTTSVIAVHNGKILSLLRGVEGIEQRISCHCHIDATSNKLDCQDDDEAIGSRLSPALLDVEDDASFTSFKHSNLGSFDGYIRDPWSRSSSFD